MPEFLHPGVLVEEVERGPRPIEGVPTSKAAILGETERGSLTPRLVTSFADYQRWFGSAFAPAAYLPYAVSGFFENGGKQAFIARIVGQTAASAQASFGDFVVRTAGPGSWGNRVFVKVEDSTTRKADGTPVGFRLRLAYWSTIATPFDPFLSPALPRPDQVEDFDDLVADAESPDFYGKRIPFIDLERGDLPQYSDSSALAILVRAAGVATGAPPAAGALFLSGGTDGAATLGVDDYIGLASNTRLELRGLAALEQAPYRDVALVYAPNVAKDIAVKIIEHCERLRFRFAIIDCPKGVANISDLAPRNQLVDSAHAAFYYPWIMTPGLRTGTPTLIPPGGHILGVYARVDTERGVFKAPANELLRGTVGLEFAITDYQQDDLNPKGVNVIRNFPGRGIRVWGARTISSNTLWKYISVRRLFIFLEGSIYEGTQWVVFEPNDERLWARVTDTIRLFLRAQWRQGALFGRTEQEAFFIKCDRTTMSQDDILNGRLICIIGIAPVKPAEFVNFRIFQHTAEAQS